jgi:carbonic anhydrase
MTARLCKLVGLVLALFLITPSLPAQEKITAPVALARLKAGNARFADETPKARNLSAERRKELLKGQKPFAIILTCADSRVVPEHIFDQGLGEIYVLRIEGNVSGPGIIGSIEEAIQALPTPPLIVVMGHENCGVIKAALDPKAPLLDLGAPGDAEGQRGWLIKQIEPGKDLPKEPKEALAVAVKNNAIRQAQLLSEKSPLIKEFVQSSRIQVVPAVYSLSTGKVEWLELPKLTGKHPVLIKVTVPTDDARVWLDDYETKSTGKVRIFEVPAIDVNEELSYRITAKWQEPNALPQSRNETVTFKGGATVIVDFTKK